MHQHAPPRTSSAPRPACRAALLAASLLAPLAGAPVPARANSGIVSACPATSAPSTWAGARLDTGTTRSGTVYEPVGAGRLALQRTGALFRATQLGSAGTIMYAAVADFNRDGYPDFAGASENRPTDYLSIFRNDTWQNANCTSPACTEYTAAGAPNWDDPTAIVAPKFTELTNLHSQYVPGTTAVSYSGRYSLAAADFDGDGWPDLFEGYAAASGGHTIGTLSLYLNAGANDAAGNPQFLPRYAAASGFTPSAIFGKQLWSTGNTQAVDYNGDGRQDVLIGHGGEGGSIRVLLGSCPGTPQPSGVVRCSSPPVLTDGGSLVTGLATVAGSAQGFGTNVSGGTPAFAYADVDLDGLSDLVVGAPNCCSSATRRLRLFKGCAGGTGCSAGLETTASQSLAFAGAATNVFIADFSLDGRPDVMVATDNWNYNSGNGAITYFYQNNGTATPFSAAPQQLTSRSASSQDYDIGFVFDYDQDPQHTPDLMIADGNDASKYYVLANRISPQYVDCGDAASGVLELGALDDDELVITAARLSPTLSLHGGTVTFWLSNEEPPNWVQASLCPGSATDYCVSFPKPVGRSVRWKAVMCSNAAHTTTPQLQRVSARFDYSRAREHYRAGVITSDGIAYVGAFHQPGDRGKVYGLNADLASRCAGGASAICWEAGAKLDARADSSRAIYTALPDAPVRKDFTASAASDPQVRALLGTPDAAATAALIGWVRSARFGLGNPGLPLTRLGAIETSTPALVGRPARPSWYSYVSAPDRARIEAFIAAHATRSPLVLVGAKDGMIHALRSRPDDIAHPLNGEEAWAYIPPTVASRMLADQTRTAAANAAAADGLNHPTIAAYPDGSPTVVDVHAGAGVYRTVALVAEGNGGRSISALDVTRTLDPQTGAVLGPTPMWSVTPGDGEAGHAYAKPAVARVAIAGAERYVVIAATGVDYTDTQGLRGRVVAGYDLFTGARLWRFQAQCPITSDLSVFETDDALEPEAPSLDGFADRVVFADRCGYVYKLAPGVDRGGGWYGNASLGTFPIDAAPDGTPQYALFATARTPGALGAERPIAGTLAARADSSTRMVLFFGTGGLENVAATAPNAFYAVYADTGAIRSAIAGGCTAGGACEKFYGGTVVTPEQVIFTRTLDPAVGTNTCDTGSSVVQAVQLNASMNNFVTDFTLAVSSAVMGSLYGDAGALYFATLAGDVARIGTPRAATAGADTRASVPQGMGPAERGTGGRAIGTTSALTMVGWRVVL
jgi:type IV pilus assembly protein PilY1